MKRKFVALIVISGILIIVSCKKNNGGGTDPGTGGSGTYPEKTDSIYAPVDPAVAVTQGFFLNTWAGINFTTPDTMTGTLSTLDATDSLTINVNRVVTKVPKYVYGNNSNLWIGQMVTEPNLVKYLKDLGPNIIRAPAGSVSDVYFFNGTDAKPRPSDAPANILDANGTSGSIGSWYGGNTASWTFSLNNYYSLLAQTNSTGIITVNYGYARYGTSANPVAAAAHLAADWVRYDNGRTKYWEIGNENFGSWEAGYRIDQSQNKDGQPALITGALYGTHFKVFADSMRAAAAQIGATIYIGAIMYDSPPASFDLVATKTWNQGVLSQAGNTPDYYIVHSYFTDYASNSTVSNILNTATTVPNNVLTFVKSQISAAGVNLKPIAMTEWNINAEGSKQKVSFVSGMHTAKTLGAIIKNGYGQASRWDLANGWSNGNDHGLFSLGDEGGGIPKWNPRPSYFYQYYWEKFFGDRMVYDTLRSVNSDITTYSSTFSSGQATTVIINSGIANHVVSIDFQHFPAGKKFYWYILTGGTDNGDFSGSVIVNGTPPTYSAGGPLNYATIKAFTAPLNGTIKLAVPARSVLYLVAEKK